MSEENAEAIAAWNDEAIERVRVDLKNKKLEQEDQALLDQAQQAASQWLTDKQLGKLLVDLTMLCDEELEALDRAQTPGTPEYEFVRKLAALVRERLQRMSEQENPT